MNEPYIQDRNHPGEGSGIGAKNWQCQCDSGAPAREARASHHTTLGSGAEGHSPVGGDSLLVAQAGGGSCTRRGELKLRRKEEDCGKKRQRGHEDITAHRAPGLP